MDCCLSHSTLSAFLPQSLPFPVKTASSPSTRLSFSLSSSGNFGVGFSFSVPSNRRRPLVVVAASGSQCGKYSGLYTPLELSSDEGLLLSRVLLNNRDHFPKLAKQLLELLACDHRDAVEKMNLCSGSDMAFLRRRMAEMQESECRTAVEDVMYVLICYRFYEIRVHMVPQVSKCIYGSRLEIWPSKDWELESIHSPKVLEMIREHLTALVGWKANSSVTDKWASTQVSRHQLCAIYTASVLYGYLIKSASLRLSLEGLFQINADVDNGSDFPVSEMPSSGSKDVFFGHPVSTRHTSVGEVSHTQGKKNKEENLKYYLMNFDSETLQRCAKPKSKEAVNLIERHASALFGDAKNGQLECNEVISTSFATLKRFVLEAIAFGSFLWEAEEYVNTIYELEEN